MAISNAESTAILQQFKFTQAHRPFLKREEILGVEVLESNGVGTIVIRVTEVIDESRALPDEILPSEFTYRYRGNETTVAVETRLVQLNEVDIPSPHCNPEVEWFGKSLELMEVLSFR